MCVDVDRVSPGCLSCGLILCCVGRRRVVTWEDGHDMRSSRMCCVLMEMEMEMLWKVLMLSVDQDAVNKNLL